MMLAGNPVSKGIAIAKAYIYGQTTFKTTRQSFDADKIEEKLLFFHESLNKAREELESLYDNMKETYPEQAKIFRAHSELLDDEEMIGETEETIKEDCLEPAVAVEKVFTEYANMLSLVEDSLIAERSADILDVKNRLVRILNGDSNNDLSHFEEDVIVIAHDLFPSDTATLDREHVKGIITEIGGSNSHTAILARSYSIPAILGVADAMKKIGHGQDLIVDAIAGEIYADFSPEMREKYVKEKKVFEKKKETEQRFLNQPCKTKDGTNIAIGLNIGSQNFSAKDSSYDFVGLFRTEFLYMERTSMPTEDEQFETYKAVLEASSGKIVTIRTLDIGGDKTLPYMTLPKEENPFLGKRALRLCLDNKELFLTQLCAILRASAYGSAQIMFPMVGSIEDVRAAKEVLEEAKQSLDSRNISYDKNIKVGIMIEIPSVAVIADVIAEEVDFASIGSNDLTQYVCAADRMNAELEPYYQSLSPAMLRLLFNIFSSFSKKGKPVSVCGEMASNPDAAAVLVGLGARKLSMSESAIASVKARLASYEISELEKMAKECMKMRTQEEIIDYISVKGEVYE